MFHWPLQEQTAHTHPLSPLNYVTVPLSLSSVDAAETPIRQSVTVSHLVTRVTRGGQGLVLLFSSCNLFLHPLYHFCYGQLIHSQPPSFRLPFANRLTFWPLPTSLLKNHRVASQMNVALGGTHCLHSVGGIMTLQGEDAPDHLLAVLRRGFSL